jgi:hypothetical protein
MGYKKKDTTYRYSDEEVKEIIGKIREYFRENDIPIIEELACKLDIRRATLYDKPEFRAEIDKCINKKIANLQKGGLHNDINVTMAIFMLKQHGFSDKHEHDHKGDIKINVKINDS